MGGLPIIVLASLLTIGSSCTVPYVAVGDRCLLFLSTLSLDHQSSTDICESLNTKPVRVNEPEQLRSLVEYIQGDVTLQNSYWIDGANIQGEWIYTDGTAIPLGTPFWATYYDNATGYGQQPIVSNIDSCLALRPDSYYYFSSRSCDEEMSPLCEEVTGTSSSVGSTSSCGGSLTTTIGEIQSPNYPGDYPVNSNCIWTITREEKSVIKITINDVDLPCRVSDWYLSIRDGSDSNSPELGKYTCDKMVDPIILVTSGKNALVSFSTSTNNDHHRGFSLTYSTEEWDGNCIYDYSSATGSVRSPLYPGMYPPNLDCSWRITVEEDSYISLTVFSFDTEIATDIVQIRDGASRNATLLSQLTGFVDTGYEVTSSGNQVFVTFTSNYGDVSNEGFALMWTSKILCPAPYLNVGQMCIHIVLYDLTFGLSGIACQEASGELAAINNAQDLRDLYVFLQNQGITDYSFWLGATDEEEEGLWKWNDDSIVPTGTPFWGTTGSYSEVQEPDGGETENCLLLQSDGMHFFRDASCDTKAPAICMHSSQR